MKTSNNLKFETMDSNSEYTLIEIKEEGEILKCGVILLLKNAWALNFKCNLCNITFKNFRTFLRHSVNHFYNLTDNEVEELLEASLKENEDLSEISGDEDSKKKLSKIDPTLENDISKEKDYLVNIEDSSNEFEALEYLSDAEELNETIQSIDQSIKDEVEGSWEHEIINESEMVNFEIELCESENINYPMEKVSRDLPSLAKKKSRNLPDKMDNDFFPHICQECSKMFKTKRNLERHQRTHQNIKPFACELCDATFMDYGNYKVHKNRHLGIQPHACEDCGKRFTTTTDLKAHMRKHSNLRPFICDICGVTYKTKLQVDRHIDRIHDNKRPFACDLCDKRFFDRRALSDHRVSHTGERDFACEICTKRFARKKTLAEHMKLHSEEFQHQCTYCEKKFQQRPGLVSHIRNFHKL